MFNSISWTEFLLVIGCLAGAYYFIAGLLCYHQEIIAHLKGAKPGPRIPTREPSADNADNLLGTIKKTAPANDLEDSDDADEIQEDEDQIHFGDSTPNVHREPIKDLDQNESPTDNGLVLGRIADLLEEVKVILSLFAD